jgi:excisionase family DNA binding protein
MTITSPSLLNRDQLAVALGVHKTTITRLTALGRIPFVSIGRRGKRYDREAVVVALNSNPIASTLSADRNRSFSLRPSNRFLSSTWL